MKPVNIMDFRGNIVAMLDSDWSVNMLDLLNKRDLKVSNLDLMANNCSLI